MAKRSESPELIEEIESGADRLAHWIAEHVWPIAGAVLALLLAVAGFELVQDRREGREAEASNALGRTRAAYLRAMGAEPGALRVPELANPEAAASIREEYLGRFQAVAEEHAGTVAGTLALFETAELLTELGRGDQTAGVWEEALASAEGNAVLQGLLHQRIGSVQESQGDWAAAAASYEAAGGLDEFPLRYWALLDAARCHAEAGNTAAARTLYQRLETEAPDLPIPDHQRSLARELQSGS